MGPTYSRCGRPGCGHGCSICVEYNTRSNYPYGGPVPLNWQDGQYSQNPIYAGVPAPPTVTVPLAVTQTTVHPGVIPAGPPYYAPAFAPAPVAPIYAGYAPYAYGVAPPPYSAPFGYPAAGNWGGYIPGWRGYY